MSYNNETKDANWVSWQLNKAWLGDVLRSRDPKHPEEPYVERVPNLNLGNEYARNFPLGFDDNFPNYPEGVQPVDGTFSPYSPNGTVLDYPWVPDQLLPTNWVKTQGGDYRNNTSYVRGGFEGFKDRIYERGHIAPINDRTRTFKDALSTYMTTNLLPMQYYVNRTPWKNLEEASNEFVKDNNAELYIIAGGAEYNLDRKYPDDYPAGHPFYNHPDPLPGVVRNLVEIAKDENGNPRIDDKGNFIFAKDNQGRIKTRNGGNEGKDYSWIENPKQIGIPEFFWKIIVPLRPGQGLADINENTQIVAVIMPNVDPRKFPNNQLILKNGTVINLSSPGAWQTYAVKVRDVEALTGYNFFSQLPEQLQNDIETRRNTSFVLPDTETQQTLNAPLLADTETQLLSPFLAPPLSVNELPSGFEELSVGQNNTNSNEIAKVQLSDSSSQINVEQPSEINHVPSGCGQIDVSHIAMLEVGTSHFGTSESSPIGGTIEVDPTANGTVAVHRPHYNRSHRIQPNPQQYRLPCYNQQ